MSANIALRCIRCEKLFAISNFASGCSACLDKGVSVNLTVSYDRSEKLNRDSLDDKNHSMWRYAQWMHTGSVKPISLGEGLTPLVENTNLGLGHLWLKDESQNPTWSFKDRLASAAVTMAVSIGAKVIASSSSGNAGAATAAYASKAGLPCVIVTYEGAAGPMVAQMRAYGAMVLCVEKSEERWLVLEKAVAQFGWYPTSVYFGPAIGSNPLGIEGYLSIAYETAEALNWDVPEWFAVPVCYGDSLFGIYKGFERLAASGLIQKMPRLLAAEVSGSLSLAMRDGLEMPPICPMGQSSVATSISAIQGTFQAIAALRSSNGVAVQVSNEEINHWHGQLASRAGMFVELSAAASLPAILKLRNQGIIKSHERVVSLLTASGLKDTVVVGDSLQNPLPSIGGTVDEAVRSLKDNYGFKVE